MKSIISSCLVIFSFLVINSFIYYIFKSDNESYPIFSKYAHTILFPYQNGEVDYPNPDFYLEIKSGFIKKTYLLRLNNKEKCLITGPYLEYANAKKAHIILPDKKVSCGGSDKNKGHLLIYKLNDKYIVADTNSSLGTYKLDDHGNKLTKIDRVYVKPNMVLGLGHSTLKFIDAKGEVYDSKKL